MLWSKTNTREQLNIVTQLIRVETNKGTMSSFSSIRSQAVSLENQTSALLSRYSSFAVSSTSSPTAEETKLEKQIETILHKVSLN